MFELFEVLDQGLTVGEHVVDHLARRELGRNVLQGERVHVARSGLLGMVRDQLGRMEQDMREVILLQLQSRVITLLALNHPRSLRQ